MSTRAMTNDVPGVLLAALIGAGTFGCRDMAKKDSAGAPDAAVATSAASPASATASARETASPKSAQGDAANTAAITRFPDEKKLGGEHAKVAWADAKVRIKPQGDMVAVLPKGTDVTKIAEHQGFFLVTFTDPKDPSRTLEGWLYKDAFTGGGDTGAGRRGVYAPDHGKCASGARLTNDPATGPECHSACKASTDCGSPKDYVCDEGYCFSAQGE